VASLTARPIRRSPTSSPARRLTPYNSRTTACDPDAFARAPGSLRPLEGLHASAWPYLRACLSRLRCFWHRRRTIRRLLG
jgi:hypothetical protein